MMGSVVTNPIMRLILGYTIGFVCVEYHLISHVTYPIMKPIVGYTNGQQSWLLV